MEFDLSLIVNSLPLLLKGAGLTLEITALAVGLGLIIGLFLGLAQLSKNPIFRWPAKVYVDVIRGTPLLIQIFIIYFALPNIIGERIDPYIAAVAACSLNSGAYIAEIFRAGIQSISLGQMRAGLSLGMTYPQTMRYIVLPQAVKRIIPPLGNEFIAMLKDSSLVSVIGFEELTRSGQLVIAETYGTMEQGAKKLLARMEKLLEGADRGKIIREGLQTVIVGKPNVGKSSLLNWLLEEDRAIVTDIPGTTRDTVEEYLNIDGIPIKIVDTAGIRETGDVVEKMGVEKSKAYAETADLVIMMLDGSRPLEEEDKEILSFIRGKKTIVLLNKVDLAQKLSLEELAEYVPQEQILFISVKENDGFDALLDALKNMFLDGHTATAEDAMLGNTRHKDALYRAKEAMEHCMETITMRMPEDFISMDLQDANRALGEITGDTSDEEIIDRIFTKFCLGK